MAKITYKNLYCGKDGQGRRDSNNPRKRKGSLSKMMTAALKKERTKRKDCKEKNYIIA